MNQGLPLLALDAGGVMFVHSSEKDCNEDTSQTEDWMPGAVDAIRTLQTKYTVIVNSFAGKKRGQQTKTKVAEVFPEIPVFIVKDRDRKWEVLATKNADIMVDDRKEILDTVRTQWLKAQERERNTMESDKRNAKKNRSLPVVGTRPCPTLILFKDWKTVLTQLMNS
jgi:hypothetical protein